MVVGCAVARLPFSATTAAQSELTTTVPSHERNRRRGLPYLTRKSTFTLQKLLANNCYAVL